MKSIQLPIRFGSGPGPLRRGGPVLILLSMLFQPLALGAESVAGWESELDGVRARGQEEKRPVVVVFVQDGCEDCAQMKATLRGRRSREVFSSGLRAMVTIQEHPETVREFGIERTPTLVVLKPGGEGMREVFRQEGSMSAGQLARVDRSVESIAAIAHPKPAAVPATPAEPLKPWGWSLRGGSSAETTSTTSAATSPPKADAPATTTPVVAADAGTTSGTVADDTSTTR